MPQMAPINWVSLYLLFTIIFMIFIIINYYSFTYKPKNISIKLKQIQSNWKW